MTDKFCKDCGKKLSLAKYIRCGFCSSHRKKPEKIIDLTNKRFGKIIALKIVGTNKWGNKLWLIKHTCCGIESVKSSGKIQSKKNILSCPNCNRHGMKHNRFYNIWHKILVRCNKQSCDKYKYYGGRGIKILWNSFKEFRDDMYKSYLDHVIKYGEKNTTIDRIDNDGNYCKENCRWKTHKEQSRNMRSNRIITFNGLSLCLSEWTEKLGFKTSIIQTRLDRYGWSIERALTEIPFRGKNQFSKRT